MKEFDIDPLVLKSLRTLWRDEIGRAIANTKRSAWDRRFRRERDRAGKWRWLGWESETSGIAFAGKRLPYSRSDFPVPEGLRQRHGG
jgi:hypothetical protein